MDIFSNIAGVSFFSGACYTNYEIFKLVTTIHIRIYIITSWRDVCKRKCNSLSSKHLLLVLRTFVTCMCCLCKIPQVDLESRTLMFVSNSFGETCENESGIEQTSSGLVLFAFVSYTFSLRKIQLELL